MKSVKKDQLKEWVDNYSKNRTHKRETMNVVFRLDELNEMMKEINELNENEKAQINCVRFYFVRQNTYGRDIVFDDQSQISLVAVPVVNYNHTTVINKQGDKVTVGAGKDYINNDTILCVFPQSPVSEHTGLCPYNCKDSLNEEDCPNDSVLP